jgi:hypothetical protein
MLYVGLKLNTTLKTLNLSRNNLGSLSVYGQGWVPDATGVVALADAMTTSVSSA